MFSLLGYHIAHDSNVRLAIETLHLKGAEEKIAKYDRVVFFVFNTDHAELVSSFVHSNALFDAKFFLLRNNVLTKLIPQNPPEPTCILFYENHKLVGSVGSIESENALLAILDLFLLEKRRVFDSQMLLLSHLGSCPTTIITVEPNFQMAKQLAVQSSLTLGPVSVALIDPSLMQSIGLPKDGFAVHRALDDVLDVFDGTVKDLLAKGKPVFETATTNRLKKVRGDCFILYTPVLMPPHRTLLYEVSKFFKDKEVFFHLGAGRLARETEAYINDNFTKNAISLEIINPSKNYFYNLTGQYQPCQTMSTFQAQAFADQLVSLIQKKQKNLLPIVYRSEKESTSHDFIQRVVGSTYQKFIESNRDVVLLFVNVEAKGSTSMFTKLKALSDNFFRYAHLCGFGFLELTRNGVEGGFPNFEAPQLVLFPKNDKAHPKYLFGGKTLNDYEWLLFLYGNETYALEPELPNRATFEANFQEAKENKKWTKYQKEAVLDFYQKIDEYFKHPEKLKEEIARRQKKQTPFTFIDLSNEADREMLKATHTNATSTNTTETNTTTTTTNTTETNTTEIPSLEATVLPQGDENL